MSQITIPTKIKNKIWRLQNLYKIRDKKRRITNLKFNIGQKLIIYDIENMKPIRYFLAKFRQIGVSTLFLLWYLDDTIFHPNTVSGILAHKWDSLHHLWSIVELAYGYLPDKYKPHLKEESKRALEFDEINSKIFISLNIQSVGLHNLHISEWCYCKDNEVRMTLGATSPDTNISGESTGNGVANDGYLTYMDAKSGDNEFKARFVPWFIQKEYVLPLNEIEPDYIMNNLNHDNGEVKLRQLTKKEYDVELTPEQILFRRSMRAKLRDEFPFNYPETFEDWCFSSGLHFFNQKKILVLLKELREYKRHNNFFEVGENYICFEPPNKSDVFVAGADTSEGMNDRSTLKIINVTKKREAFKYRARVGIKTFYRICDEWCRKYNNAYLAVERNNTGHAVLLGLDEICRYNNLYEERLDKRLNIKMSDKPKVKLGWSTDSKSRTKMIVDLKDAVEGEEEDLVECFEPIYTIYDEDFLMEALTFVNKDGKYEAEEGKHDDEVIASAIAFQMFLFKYIAKKQNKSLGGNIFLAGKERESSQF